MWTTGDISVATITDLRNQTSDIAEAVKESKMRVIITKNDEPVGVFIPFSDYTEHVEGKERQEFPSAGATQEGEEGSLLRDALLSGPE